MKKFCYVIFIGTAIFILTVFIGKKFAPADLHINDGGVSWNIIYKGLQGGRDFTVDDEGSTYIAFKERIQKIDSLGYSRILYEDSSMDISDIEYYDGKIYIASDTRIVSLTPDSGDVSEILCGIPSLGDYKKVCMSINDGSLYVSVGSVTNAGVAGSDNDWISDNKYLCDLSPSVITLNGLNFNSDTTGAFCPYGIKCSEGEKVKAFFPGNSSIMKYSLKDGKCILYAWGIRNVEGMDYDSQGKLMGTVGGIEPRGERGVDGDVDYIYSFNEGMWYGWPDFSGGDPITSPRFASSGEKKLEFIMKKHPSENPPQPYYQHKSLSSLGTLAIDREGCAGERDKVYFYDKADKIIYSIGNKGIAKKVASIDKGTISSMKFALGSLRVLDGENGNMYDINAVYADESCNRSPEIIYASFIIIIGISAALIIRFIKRKYAKG